MGRSKWGCLKRVPGSVAVLLTSMGVHTIASATIIDFDVDASNNPIASGTVIDNTYSSLGVTLSSIQTCPTCSTTTTGDAFADAAGLPLSSPNVLGIRSDQFLFDNRWGVAVVAFSTLQQNVGIYAAAVPFVENLGQPELAKPFLTAYDSAHNFLGSALYGPNEGDALYGSFQQLIFNSASANIAEIHLGSQQPSQFAGPNSIVYGIFDNLAFGSDVTNTGSTWYAYTGDSGTLTYGPGPQEGPDGTTSVPEPGTLAMLTGGLFGLGALGRQKARA